MKKIGFLRLGLTFAGCFLGAGYVSGQELWQFFGSFGSYSPLGLGIAMLVLFLTGVIMLEINRIGHASEIGELVVPWDIPPARFAVIALELLFLFGVCVIMTAGVGALLNQLFGLPVWVGALVFATVVCICSLAGLGGMVKAFSATVPVLAAVTLIFGIVSVSQNGFVIAEAKPDSLNPLMGSWFAAAISFACYNLFGSIAMIAPLGEYMKSKKASIGGIFTGVLLLSLIAGSVLTVLGASPRYADSALPMLAYAEDLGTVTGYIYGVLLLLAMFGTALSSLVGFGNILGQKFPPVVRRKKSFTALCGAAIFFGSLFGFGELISVIYPIFGYCSSIFIVLMAVHYFKIKGGKKNVKA